jgi:putative ubiquitin-RnfH superfamily antitoxin RatB of RatAB toxin-antitoxin module
MANPLITIEVAYILPQQSLIIPLNIEMGSGVSQAIVLSNILTHFPHIDLNSVSVGIFGQICSLDHILTQGDRVEIYRPLLCDPKQARRNRAIKNCGLLLKKNIMPQ